MMQHSPLVSIALCTYNGAEFLHAQLESVLNQTHKNWEMVVVDDLSTDHTWEILKSYAAKDSRIQLHRNAKNLGYNRNFERALRLCTAEFIAICDQDDIWDSDKIAIQLAGIGTHELVYHDSEFVDKAGREMNIRMSDKFNFYRGHQPEVFLYLNCVSGHSILMKRALLAAAVPFPTAFHYDQWLAFVAASRGTIDFTNRPLIRYRQHAHNNTDVLARTSIIKDSGQKVAELKRETEWLKICAEKAPDRPLIHALYRLSASRNRSLFKPSYGILIWENRNTLLFLLRKSGLSKLFYTLRKIWGAPVKKLL